jgi:hypothetical protein
MIFHRKSKGKAGQPVKDFSKEWRNALRAANLPEGRIFHDLRRSAVRTLIRSGIDPSVAMKISGHKTNSMLHRYDIVDASDTGAAFRRADEYLLAQPTELNVTPIVVGEKPPD